MFDYPIGLEVDNETGVMYALDAEVGDLYSIYRVTNLYRSNRHLY